MHPLKSKATDSLNAKMRSMTRDYGAASGPANNITSPQERLKGEAGEAHVGFGADSENAGPKRGDRPARRSMAANPVATYAKGGKVKKREDGGDVGSDSWKDAQLASMANKKPVPMPTVKGVDTGDKIYVSTPDPTNDKIYVKKRGGGVKKRDGGGDVSAIEEANKNEAASEAAEKSSGGVIARAKGGRTKGHKGSTHVNVMIAPQGAGGPPTPPAGPSPQLAALLAGAHPPAPPMAPPAGAPPMGAGPMAGPPPGAPPMMPRAKGGKVMGGSPTAPADATEKTLREEGLVRKAKGGGLHMTAGAVTGEGRLQKMGITKTHRGSMSPKAV